MLEEVPEIAKLGVLSGGWAWHWMSPPHKELKIHHDHKDFDLLVPPTDFPFAVNALKERGYERVWTRHDGKSSTFYRYEKRVECEGVSVKFQIDVFTEDVPYIEVNGIRVVEPSKLLSFYKRKIHSTDDCTAVRAARLLLEKGINPVGRPELIGL